jgi:hypothetical protein
MENMAVFAKPARKRNRGSFSVGDPRINRRGRPKGAVVAAHRARDGKPLSGRLKMLSVPLSDLRQFLTCPKHPWLVNLPCDMEIVDVRVDVKQSVAEIVLHSQTFGWVDLGHPLPKFPAEYNGLKWRQRSI